MNLQQCDIYLAAQWLAGITHREFLPLLAADNRPGYRLLFFNEGYNPTPPRLTNVKRTFRQQLKLPVIWIDTAEVVHSRIGLRHSAACIKLGIAAVCLAVLVDMSKQSRRPSNAA